jgi:rRNA maturation endonuclease Nob1
LSQPLKMAITGTAVVVCVHNREKRQVTDLAFDYTREKVHMCACCENLFTRPDDVPHYCQQCGGRPVYRLAAPLKAPIGEV